jgi:hypothetical protein
MLQLTGNGQILPSSRGKGIFAPEDGDEPMRGRLRRDWTVLPRGYHPRSIPPAPSVADEYEMSSGECVIFAMRDLMLKAAFRGCASPSRLPVFFGEFPPSASWQSAHAKSNAGQTGGSTPSASPGRAPPRFCELCLRLSRGG